ncbi:Uncharacterised protein [Bordetella pertussis]|nr:Uncharacterised protein [Bordetella pertussis]
MVGWRISSLPSSRLSSSGRRINSRREARPAMQQTWMASPRPWTSSPQASAMRSSARRVLAAKRWPSRVRARPRPSFFTNRVPTASSRFWIWRDTTVWEIASRSAAARILPLRLNASNARTAIKGGRRR